MKITRKQLRKLVEQAAEEGSDLTDEKQKEIDDAVAQYLADEGGAASEEGTEKIVSDKVDGVNAKAYLAKKERFKQLTVGNDPQDYYDTTLAEVRRSINEIFGFQSGQFDMSAVGRSGGPEMASEEEYIKKAQAAAVDLRKYEDIIGDAASKQNIDEGLLYGILIDEHMRMYPRAAIDILGYFGLMDTSVGVSQMKGSRAKQISADGYYVPEGHTAEQIQSMSLGKLQRMIANSPKIAINYAAGYIKYIVDNWQLGDKNEFFDQLEKNARVATLYSHPNVDKFKGRTPDPESGYEGIRPPGASRRGSRAGTVSAALRGDIDLMPEALIRKIILEKLEKIGFYDKYSYGLDDIPDKTKAHDDIVGHT